MSLRKLDLDALRADLAAVEKIIASTSEEEDPFGYQQFVDRRDELAKQISDLEGKEQHRASVGLFFGGRPVLGSRGILSDFAGNVIALFQDLVAKRMAAVEAGPPGRRGPVALRAASELMVTDMARGSVGFVLEEASDAGVLTETALKVVVDQAVSVVANIASPDEQEFERAAESLDDRQLSTLRTLFAVLHENAATVRLVEDDREAVLDDVSVHRGMVRTEALKIEESESESLTGVLYLMPLHRRFELLQDDGTWISGNVSPEYSQSHLEALKDGPEKVVGRKWRTRMRIRHIRRFNRPARTAYTLLSLLEELKRKS